MGSAGIGSLGFVGFEEPVVKEESLECWVLEMEGKSTEVEEFWGEEVHSAEAAERFLGERVRLAMRRFGQRRYAQLWERRDFG